MGNRRVALFFNNKKGIDTPITTLLWLFLVIAGLFLIYAVGYYVKRVLDYG